MIRQNLSTHDIDMIDRYVRLFGRTTDFNFDYLLREWDHNKVNWYYNILDKSFDVKIAEGTELFKASSDMIEEAYNNTSFCKYLWSITNKLKCEGYDCGILEAFTARACLDNKLYYNAQIFIWNRQTNKYIKVFARTSGMRFFKAWKAFVKAIEESQSPLFQKAREIIALNKKSDEELEQMRIELSKISQVKANSLELHLSIHPLDFMTASDNINNWGSCMSWKNSGCYRTGTVEMMNSKFVACAYLCDTSKPMHIGRDDCVWNNKIWRAWVYDLDGLTMVGKGYPYDRPDLSNIILDYLRSKETIQEHCIFPKRKTMEQLHGNYDDDDRWWLKFYMDWMYNDMEDSCNWPYFMCDAGQNIHHEYDISAIVKCFTCGGIRDRSLEEDKYYKCGGELASDEVTTWNFMCYECTTDYDVDALPQEKIKVGDTEYSASNFPSNANGLYFDPFLNKHTLEDPFYPKHYERDYHIIIIDHKHFDEFNKLEDWSNYDNSFGALETKYSMEDDDFMTRHFYSANPVHLADERLHLHHFVNSWDGDIKILFGNDSLFANDEKAQRNKVWNEVKTLIRSITLY